MPALWLGTRARRKEIILPPDAPTPAGVRPRRAIVVALAGAYKWQKTLDEGEVGSLDELAAQHGVDRSYVGRVLKLTGLAPDIVASVLAGTEDGRISLKTVRGPLPLLWQDQRRRGSPSR